jgi:4-oxalocrotonate tautomerase
MPLATIKVIEGVFSGQERQRMVENVSEAIVAVEGENLREKTVVLLEEVKSGDWAYGGKTVATDAVKKLRASR